MKTFQVTVTNLEPFCIRADRADDRITTLDYIPGTTLMGALAAYYLQTGTADARFRNFFDMDKIIYPALYPAQTYNGAQPGASPLAPAPLPLSACTCKHFGGFKDAGNGKKLHGVYDNLFHYGIIEETGNINELAGQDKCSQCADELLVPFHGFFIAEPGKVYRLTERVNVNLHTHTGINRKTGTVSESVLFNMEIIEASYTFTGKLHITDESLCLPFLKQFQDREIHIGAKKTAGMGTCRINIKETSPVILDDFRKRLEQFDAAYKTYKQQQLKQSITDDSCFYFAIDLYSDSIRLDPFLNYLTGFKNLDAEWNLPGIELIYEKCRTREIMGWNNSIGLPRQMELGIARGSTALFKSTSNLIGLAARLLELEQQGIGVRKAEGFGQCILSSAFHTDSLKGL